MGSWHKDLKTLSGLFLSQGLPLGLHVVVLVDLSVSVLISSQVLYSLQIPTVTSFLFALCYGK